MNRHAIWRVAQRNRDSFDASAPDGVEAVVEAYVVGRREPMTVAEVQTRRFAWTLLGGPDEGADSRLVFVPDGATCASRSATDARGRRQLGSGLASSTAQPATSEAATHSSGPHDWASTLLAVVLNGLLNSLGGILGRLT